MKKRLFCSLFACAILGVTQLGAMAENATGFVYKETCEAGSGSGSVAVSKVGSAECVSYFGIVATGNCSITQAMRNGKVSNLSHYDYAVKNILGYKKITIKAYGQ